MLLIAPESTGAVLKTIEFATSIGKLDNFLHQLKYRDSYGIGPDDPVDKIIVELYEDSWNPHCFSFVTWEKNGRSHNEKHFPGCGKYNQWLVGGIIFHKDSQTWGSHT